jgi:hypothetical protein
MELATRLEVEQGKVIDAAHINKIERGSMRVLKSYCDNYIRYRLGRSRVVAVRSVWEEYAHAERQVDLSGANTRCRRRE